MRDILPVSEKSLLFYDRIIVESIGDTNEVVNKPEYKQFIDRATEILATIEAEN